MNGLRIICSRERWLSSMADLFSTEFSMSFENHSLNSSCESNIVGMMKWSNAHNCNGQRIVGRSQLAHNCAFSALGLRKYASKRVVWLRYSIQCNNVNSFGFPNTIRVLDSGSPIILHVRSSRQATAPIKMPWHPYLSHAVLNRGSSQEKTIPTVETQQSLPSSTKTKARWDNSNVYKIKAILKRPENRVFQY